MKPKMLFFCASFTSGGVEKVMVNLANHFSTKGYDTNFLVCRNIGDLNIHLSDEVKVFALNKRLITSFRAAVSFFRAHHFDTVICGPQFINILAVIAIKLFLRKKITLILTHHSFYDLDVKNMAVMHMFYKSLIAIFYKYADVTVAVSSAVKDHLMHDIGLSEENIQIIYNPVIDNDFNKLAAEPLTHKWLTNNKNFKVLVCVGRLSKVKNQEALINLMPYILEHTACKLLFIGDGEEREYLTELTARINMQDYIDFIGSIENPIKFIAASDLLILPSISETFSLVAVEAIAVGTPVLSTPTLGVKEILGECEGCFFEMLEEKERFVETMVNLLQSEHIKVDREFAQRFKVDLIGADYERLVKVQK